ncbi:coil containing protein [Vibrio phage LP.1]|nr:coil containing protein [Vibrio phage LP.1]
MPYITHQKDPAMIAPPDCYQVPDGTHLVTWLHETFVDADAMCGDLACDIIINGRVIYRNDDDNYNPNELDFITLNAMDTVSIVNRPAGIEVVAIVIAVISIAASVYMMATMNTPQLPGAGTQANESPNNRLNAATNEFRPNQAIPECFGRGVSYPDFAQPSYYFYENNVRRQVELFTISVGTVNVPEIRVAETEVSEIPNTSATVYLPGQSVPNEYLNVHRGASTVSEDVLQAPNDGNVIKGNVTFGVIGGNPTTDLTFSDKNVIYDLALSAGGYIYLRSSESLSIYPTSGTAQVSDICPVGTQALRNGSVFHRTSQAVGGEITALDFGALTATVGGVSVTLGAAESSLPTLNGVLEITNVDINATPAVVTVDHVSAINGTYVGSVGRGYSQGVIGEGTNGELDTWVGWFEVPGDEIGEVWIHWKAPQGIRNLDGDGNSISASITLEMQIESLDSNGDPTGNIWTQNPVLQGNTLDAQFRTTIFTPEDFPAMTRSGYRVRTRRITNVISGQGRASERVQLEGYVSVTPYSNPNFGDVTMLLMLRNASLFGADQAGKKINCDYERLLPTYDRNTGVYDQNTLTATDSFADAAAYTLIKAGGTPESRVDLSGLYEIYDGLSDPQLGGFTFTFDDENVSMGERIDAICAVARVSSFGENALWEFSRDEAKPVRSALFNRRSLIDNQGQQTYMLQRSDDADSVIVYYVDPDTNTEKSIKRRIDIESAAIVNGETGSVPKEIRLTGCRNSFQATNRADLEIRRIAYQRHTIRDIARREALEVRLTDRVGWVDINDTDYFDGEILGINGSTYDTSERFEPIDGETYFVYITDNEGYPSNSVQCFPRTDTEFGFIASGISGAFLPNGDEQLGSRYFIANASNLSAQDFTLVKRAPTGDRKVEIELVSYDSRMYEMDDVTLPDGIAFVPVGIVSTDYQQTPNAAQATLTFESDGDITFTGGSSIWHSNAPNTGIGQGYQLKVSQTSGDTPSADFALDTWVDMTTSRTLTLDQSGVDVADAIMEVQIREIADPSNIASGEVRLVSAELGALSLPVSVTATVANQPNEATCRFDLESDGTWTANDGQVGAYITSGYNVGSQYEARATNLAGDTPAGLFDVWVALDGSGTEWTLYTQASATATFDVEVREIANTANTNTCTVTLNAGVA